MAEEITVSTVLDQLSSITQQMNGARLLVGGVVTDVEKLRSHLEAIREVLDDAEKRQVKDVKDKAVEDWLRELTDTCYAVDDALDEWNTAIQKLLLANETDRSVCFHFIFNLLPPWVEKRTLLRTGLMGRLDFVGNGRVGVQE